MSVAQNMMLSVRWLDTLSQIVRLAFGMLDDGIKNGNIDAPAVPITPAKTREEEINAIKVCRADSNTAVNIAPAIANIGKIQSSGW